MGDFIALKVLNEVRKKLNKSKTKILICGLTFKENCPDLRNSKVYDIIEFLSKMD